ncbi:lipopolysaccharide kinase InaA family protein [Methanotorris igneus]|uniref:Tyrosine protein kinase n=1 Tax=Methanotorris igneus (strain DSM 5666 / JCM 11834 / Kol 5) TaxID=880724 RepID=F6BCU4_METIK|nr:lipopolysaccharide kinase InaA family protein [Methanotorris igneus]AEF96305.1 tyrosine protein kinase [Methanotorris igneus Kol 5]
MLEIKGYNEIIKNILNEEILKKLIDEGVVFKEVVGKGHRGVVLRGEFDGKDVAIKIPRKDTPKNTVLHEGKMLEIVNKVSVGPKVYRYSNDYLITEFVDGVALKYYVENLTKDDKEKLLKIVEEIFRQCVRLDLIGIDHGEIQGGKHILINDSKNKVWIIDFDKADIRFPRNFTSAISLLFGESPLSKKIKEILDVSEEEVMMLRKFAKMYKKKLKK